MKRKHYSVEQIVAILKQAEVGVLVAEPIHQAGISEQTFIAGRNSMLGWRWTRFVRRRPRGKLPRIALATDENLDVCTATSMAKTFMSTFQRSKFIQTRAEQQRRGSLNVSGFLHGISQAVVSGSD